MGGCFFLSGYGYEPPTSTDLDLKGAMALSKWSEEANEFNY
jgi:hypothetical protein